jgi:hypothetical protein
MPSTDKARIKSKILVAQTTSQVAVYAKGLKGLLEYRWLLKAFHN